ncbi:MAG: efflux RND transporter periplasmic adaptor subunit, partial [Candidatus Polarisedimenticolia bacterium]
MRTSLSCTSLLAAAACGCALLLPGCARSQANPGPPPTPEVGVVALEERPLVLTTVLSGRTAPYVVAEIRPQVGGIVRQRPFQEGSDVAAGQLLYEIEPATYKAAVDSAAAALARDEATLATAQLKATRYAELVRTKAVSEQENDDAQMAVRQGIAVVAADKAALDAAKVNMGYTRVTSPIAGRIGRSAVTQGALVTAGQPNALATVQRLDPIYVDVTQSSAELLRLKRDLANGKLRRPDAGEAEVRLTLEDGTEYPLAGRLALSEATVEQSTGTVTLRAVFPNPDRVLLPGMFVRATVKT